MYAPSVFEESSPTSRKEHICCECKEIIPAGVVYSLIKGLWDGEWDDYKTCGKCRVKRLKACALAKELSYDYDEFPTFSNLQEWIWVYESDTGDKF